MGAIFLFPFPHPSPTGTSVPVNSPWAWMDWYSRPSGWLCSWLAPWLESLSRQAKVQSGASPINISWLNTDRFPGWYVPSLSEGMYVLLMIGWLKRSCDPFVVAVLQNTFQTQLTLEVEVHTRGMLINVSIEYQPNYLTKVGSTFHR
jgi:hypothetical protein